MDNLDFMRLDFQRAIDRLIAVATLSGLDEDDDCVPIHLHPHDWAKRDETILDRPTPDTVRELPEKLP